MRQLAFLLPFLLPAVASTQELEAIRASSELVDHTSRQVVSRSFYTSPLRWFFRASTFGNLSMRGYDSSEFGGTITRVTGCFYNESAFSRRLTASMWVEQDGDRLQRIDFGRNFDPERFSCHTLTGFDVQIEPGEFEIVVSYDRGEGDNFWFGLGATERGTVYDVQIGLSRPPTIDGPQGTENIRGVGISYVADLFEESQEPPEPPPPPPPEPLCTPTNTALCLGEDGRFRVSATFDDGTRRDVAMARAFDDIKDSGLFWFYSAGNLEMLVKILDGCPINQRFWVYFAATTDVGFELTVEDLDAGAAKVYANQLGVRANATTDIDAFATCP